jgi:hypothetical protein
VNLLDRDRHGLVRHGRQHKHHGREIDQRNRRRQRLARHVAHPHVAARRLEPLLLANALDRVRRKVDRVDDEVRTQLEQREESVADAAPDLEQTDGRGSVAHIGVNLGELETNPVAILEEIGMIPIVKLVPHLGRLIDICNFGRFQT